METQGLQNLYHISERVSEYLFAKLSLPFHYIYFHYQIHGYNGDQLVIYLLQILIQATRSTLYSNLINYNPLTERRSIFQAIVPIAIITRYTYQYNLFLLFCKPTAASINNKGIPR